MCKLCIYECEENRQARQKKNFTIPCKFTKIKTGFALKYVASNKYILP